MERGGLGTSIGHADLDQDIFRALFGVFDEDVKVTVVVEDACVQQLILELISAPAAAGPVRSAATTTSAMPVTVLAAMSMAAPTSTAFQRKRRSTGSGRASTRAPGVL